ncbi:AAA family ATPase [Corynebacterium ammoniagenes]|uniref:AAA family ATPase n=1 Tax=Corynebacterium ammoniagenes TaxID=1697 RepID=UPI0030B8E9AF
MTNSFERLREAVEAAGLQLVEQEAGVRARFQTPGHEVRHTGDLNTAITYTGELTLIHSHDDDADRVLEELGLSKRDLFDNPRGSTYEYSDGFVVSRSPEKYFSQLCKHGMKPTKCSECKGKLTTLYGIDSLQDDQPVYVVEGEKDVNTAINVCGVAAVSQVGGASNNPKSADWSLLAGRDVIIVQDDDKPGEKRTKKLLDYFQSMDTPPKDIVVTKALVGKDLSDHVAAGKQIHELVAIEAKEASRRKIELFQASTVKTERLEWLMPNWIPLNSITLLAGREGLGKSTIACGIAAQATTGELTGKPMNVAYVATEDSLPLTVKPRLQAAGADLERTLLLKVTTEEGREGALSLPGDTDILADALEEHNVKLVILDAAKSAMFAGLDGYKDDHVRQFLEPLAAMCDRLGIVVLGLVHFGKRESADSGKLILGSIAWSQIARSVLSVAADEEGTLVVTNTKGNLAPKQVSREARIESVSIPTDDGEATDVGRIIWGDETDRSAADLLVSHDDQEDRTEVEAVVLDYLESQGGTASAGEVLKVTRAAGLSDNTVKKARKKIGVKTVKAGMNGGWVWTIDQAGEYFSKVPEGAEDSRANIQAPSAPSAAPSGEATSTEPSLTVVHDEVVGTILESLSPEYPMSLKVLQGSVLPDQRDQVQEALDQLTQQGAVTTDSKGRYLLAHNKKEEAA